MQIRNQIAHAVRFHRLEAGLTLKDLADLLDMNWRQVMRWEHGESVPRPATMERIAAVLDIPESELVPGESDETDPVEALSEQVRHLTYAVAQLQTQMATLTEKRDKGEIPNVGPMVPAEKVQRILERHGIGLTELARRMDWRIKTTGKPDPTSAGREIGRYGNRTEVSEELAVRILKACDIDPAELTGVPF